LLQLESEEAARIS